jgi:HEPN domain-containing protein
MSENERRRLVDLWFNYAREDLTTAERLLADAEIPPRQSCFHAQQAAEKAIKAALVEEQIDFPYRHNLNELLDLLPDRWQVKCEFPSLDSLTQWAVAFRYPGDWLPPTEDDARHAVAQARGVVESIAQGLSAQENPN